LYKEAEKLPVAAQSVSERTVHRVAVPRMASEHADLLSSANPGLLQRDLLARQRLLGNRHVGHVLRQAEGGGDADGMAAVEQSINGARGGGQALDHGTKSQMENAFGADFSGVRIHHDDRADQLSETLSARAFTTGQDIFFRSDEYRPGTSAGRELLAHELTHVVQQGSAEVRRKMTVSSPEDDAEREANSVARAVMALEHGGTQRVDDEDDRSAQPPVVARKCADCEKDAMQP
jgi:hypothetical protein